MATFKASEADNYGNQGSSGFFSIDTNRGKKKIRIMYDSVDDIQAMSVHKVKVNGKDRYVNCPRAYDDPLDKCPFCGKYPLQVRLFVPVYDIESDSVQIWDRGRTMIPKMTSIAENYAEEQPLVSTIFEVQRIGEPGDKNTTYEFFSKKTDDTTFDDLPELPKILGGLVLDKTAEEMTEYLRTDKFPSDGSDDSEEPVRRRSSQTARRTPSRREERF